MESIVKYIMKNVKILNAVAGEYGLLFYTKQNYF